MINKLHPMKIKNQEVQIPIRNKHPIRHEVSDILRKQSQQI